MASYTANNAAIVLRQFLQNQCAINGYIKQRSSFSHAVPPRFLPGRFWYSTPEERFKDAYSRKFFKYRSSVYDQIMIELLSDGYIIIERVFERLPTIDLLPE